MKAYRYLFYKLYSWLYKSDIAEYKAIFGISILITLNLLTLPQLFGIIAETKVHLPKLSKEILIIIGISHILIHYFLLVFNNKYKRIIEEFEHENKTDKKKGDLFVLVYVTSSVVFLLVSLFIERFING